MFAFAVLSLTTFALSVSIALVLATKAGIKVKKIVEYAAFGMLGWVAAKIPKVLVILPYMLSKGLPLQVEEKDLEILLRDDLLFLFLGALTAGVFEEIAKPAGLLFVKKDFTSTHKAAVIGWIAGAGCGWLEAVNFIGGEAVKITMLGQGTFDASPHIPVERLLIILQHGALTSSLVYLVVKRRRFLAFFFPITNHTAMDLAFPYLQVHKIVTNPWMIQLMILAWVAVTTLCVVILFWRVRSEVADHRNAARMI